VHSPSAACPGLLRQVWEQHVSLTLVHHDRDFDQVTNVTGPAAVWLAPAGSVS